MITNELNIGLIEAAKEKMPTGTNLANTLMDILYIGKEAIYRRLRGEVPFTLAEAAIISRKLGISLDKMIGVSFSNNAVFDLNVVHHTNTFETYHDILTKYVDAFDNIREDPTTEMATYCLKHYISNMMYFQSFVCLNGCTRMKISNASILMNWKFPTKYITSRKTLSI
jgi:hypothetical protein